MMKLFAGLAVVTSAAVIAAVVVDHGRSDRGAVVQVASPADTFVVHDAPAPATPAPPPAPAPAADQPAAPSALDAAIAKLRAQAAAKPDASVPALAPALSPALASTPAPATPDPLLAGPNPAPSILAGLPPPLPPPQVWTAVTAQGARWRASSDATGPLLILDMGGGKTATVHVDPAFQRLPPEAAGARVDFLKQTILGEFSTGIEPVPVCPRRVSFPAALNPRSYIVW